MATELAESEDQVALTKAREERQNEAEAWKPITSRSKAKLSKVREEIPATVDKLRAERDSAAASHQELLVVICRIVRAHEET